MNQSDSFEYNRRDFLKGGSMATLMTMLGGVQLFGAEASTPAESKPAGPKLKIGVIGLGTWGREILNTLAVEPNDKLADVAVICDNYAASLKRATNLAPKAAQTNDYKTILGNKEVKAVVIATPTHLHKEVVLAALEAGKHVYCEAPLAATLEDAREIAKAAAAAKALVFQAGLQLRSDKQRLFMLPFIRSGALGQWVMARSQFNKKQTWRATSPNAEREKALNWRLNKATSTGLVGELGSHSLDQAVWFFNALPIAVSGIGSIAFQKDGREIPDTVQASFEFPNGVFLTYTATLANSFDANYDMFYGSDAAVMIREGNAWMFKEVDSPLLGWEVYAKKEMFYKETGIMLKAGASKSTGDDNAQAQPYTNTALSNALENFVRNAADVANATEDFISSFGEDDKDGLLEQVAKVLKRPAAGAPEGFQAAVLAIKGHEATMAGQRIPLKPELFELS
jgi:predicted dehydrogenase